MKSQLNLNRVGSCIWFVVVVAIALSFLGCKTQTVAMPITDSIINEVKNSPNPAFDFQYYISKTIILSIVPGQYDSKIEDSRLKRVAASPRDTVVIAAFTRGKMLVPPTGNTFNVAFEAYPNDPVISFRKLTSDRYEMVIDPNGEITYGTVKFTVHFNGAHELPYLMIMTQEKPDRDEVKRSVKGLIK
ncbi:MAG: hypothetical protein LBQ94_09580 [Treponema sp.]|jgi:hypothetical protein|nr:hypothetical protein [Treponema sp.]